MISKLFRPFFRQFSTKRAKRGRTGWDRQKSKLCLERLEKRELLSNDAPRIVAVTPADGSLTTNPNPTLSVTFSESMNPTEASTASNYQLFNSSGNAIPIVAAAYDSVHHQVTLGYTPPGPASPPPGLPSDQYTLFVRGDQIHDTDDDLPLSQARQLIVANPGTQSISTVNVPGDGNLGAVTNFADASTQGSTVHPTAVAIADVTGDGLPDLLLLSSGSNTVELFRGLSNGSFEVNPSVRLDLPANAGAQAMLVTNLRNATGVPDVAVADTGLSEVTVFINGGNGSFTPTTYSAGKSPVSITSGDFNRDGVTDLAFVSNLPSSAENTYLFTILPQDPANAGKFLAPRSFDTGLTTPNSLAAGDFNQDSKPDLVISSGSGMRILFNTTVSGNLNFAQAAALTTISTAGVVVGNVNSSSFFQDIVAITKTNNGQVLVFQSLGGGFFASPVTINLNALPTSVALADLNGDGKNDILVTSGQGTSSRLTVLLNQSTTGISFSSPVLYTVDNTPVAIGVHTINTAGGADEIATANLTGNDATILRVNANGTLRVSTDIGVPAGLPSAVLVADLNNDLVPDLIVANLPPNQGFFFTDSISIFLNRGNGTYAAPITVNVGNDFFSTPVPLALAVADLTGSGAPDIIVSNPSDFTITVIANGGNGSFAAQTPIVVGGVPRGIAVGDFGPALPLPGRTEDGIVDLAIAHDGGVTVLFGQGNRSFNAVEVGTDISPIAIVAADFNQDNTVTQNRHLDLAVIDGQSTGMVQVLLGTGTQAFNKRPAQSAGSNPTSLAVADLNNDNFPDLVVATHNDPTATGTFTDSITVLLNDAIPGPANAFGAPIKTDVLTNTRIPIQAVAVADLNHDLFPDVVAASQGSTNNLIDVFGLGNGRFRNDIRQFSSAGGGAETGGSSAIGNIIATIGNNFIRATTFFVASSLVNSNLVVNGGFESSDLNLETGNLANWQTGQEPGSHGQWAVQSGNVSTYSGQTVPLPPQGGYTAMLDEPDVGNDLANALTFGEYPATQPSDYSGTHVLYQDIMIPDAARQATLSFSLFFRSQAAFTDTSITSTLDYTPNPPANQQVRVDIMDPLTGLYSTGAGVLRNLFVTRPNTPTDSVQYLTFSDIDLTAFHGRTVRFRVATANNQGKLIVGVDNVQLQALYTATTAPALNGIQLRNPGFGATATFGGNSSDPTIVGTVADIGSPANIAFLLIDPNNDGFGPVADADDFAITAATGGIDSFGHFSFTLPTVLPDGQQILPGPITVGIKAVNRAGLASTTTFSFNYQGPSLTAWQARGPNQVRFTGAVDFSPHGDSVVSGRILSIAADPHDSTGNTYIIGADNGGVWRTTDGGNNWTPLTDFVVDSAGNPVPEAISSVVFDPRVGSRTIYAATGVADDAPTSHPGVGILRSTDGGATWSLVGSSVFNGARISKLAITSQGFLYAAVGGGATGLASDSVAPGVYYSTDMGQTWTNLLTIASMIRDDGTPLPAGTRLASVTDVAVDPLNEERVWIGLGNIGVLKNDNGSFFNSITAGVWFSDSHGTNWHQLLGGHNENNVFYSIHNSTIPSGINVGRVTIALPSVPLVNESIAYIMMSTPPTGAGFAFSNGNSMNPQMSGVGNNANIGIGLYKTRDGGRSFTPVMVRENVPTPTTALRFVNLFTLGHEAADVGALAVDPTNPNIFYVGGSTRFGIDDEGSTFPVPRHAFLRIDTSNMRDTSYVTPFLPPESGKLVIPNDGDDIIKATQAALNSAGHEPGSYGAGGGYQGEGVFWYDLATTDFGQRFSLTGAGFNERFRIPESIHALAFDAHGRLLVGTELGIWRGVSQGFVYDTTSAGEGVDRPNTNTPLEQGMLFTDLNTNLQITDTTSVAIDAYNRNVIHSTQAGSGWARTDGGLQWVSTNTFTPDSTISVAGDEPFAGPIRTGPRNPNAPAGTLSNVYRDRAGYLLIAVGVNGIQVERSTDGGRTFTGATHGLTISSISAGFLPLAVNPSPVPDINGIPRDELLFWTNQIFESDDSANFWDPAGPNAFPPSPVTALAFGPSQADVFYVGTAPQGTVPARVYADLRGGGDSFATRAVLGDGRFAVNGITVDPSNAMIAYAMLDGFNTGQGHVFRTTDGGVTWTNISGSGVGGLPDVPAYAMAIDPRSTPDAPNGKIFLGNGVGAYFSTDFASGSPHWQRLGLVTLVNPDGSRSHLTTLPNVPVLDLQFNRDFETLAAATEGRGVFEISTDRAGAHVASMNPVTPSSPGFSAITVTFNKPVDPRTFTPSAITSLRGPGGVVPVLSVVDIDPSTHLSYQINFAPQILDGTYDLVLSQSITDFVGFALDQNQNGISGEPSDTFSARFAINTTDNGRFISGAYNDILGRSVDTGAFLAFLPTLDANRFAAQGLVATTIVASQVERASLINSYYQNFLGRPAQATELTQWLAALTQGITPEQVITAILESPEYFQKNGSTDLGFINAAYLNTLGRNVDPNGLAAFLNLAEVAPRSAIVSSLVRSTEYLANLVQGYYARFVPTHGGPTPGELGAWIAALQNRITDEQAIAFFIGSPEYFTNHGGNNSLWLAAAYNDILGRAEDSGAQGFLDLLNSGRADRATVALALLLSPEYRGDLLYKSTLANPNPVYTTFLGRSPNIDEINGWLGAFTAGATDEALITVVASSSEYFQRVGTGSNQVQQDQSWLISAYSQLLGRAVDPGAQNAIPVFLAANEQSARNAFSAVLPASGEYQTNFVTQTYITLLGRRPAAIEIANWQTLLSQPSAGANHPSPHEQFEIDILQSVEYFFRQREPNLIATSRQWVASLFTTFLGRPSADPSETQPLLQILLNAYQTQRLAVANLLDTSYEYRLGFVGRTIKTYLRRDATPVEITLYTTGAKQNFTDEQIIADLIASTEYFQNVNLGNGMNSTWVNRVYRDVLGRDRDPAAQSWIDALNAGTLTRQQVANAILSSTEYRGRLVDQMFLKYLHRDPVMAETNNFVSLLQNGSTDEQLISLLTASNEYFLESHPYP